ncbi:MAG: hypothetical protein ACYC4H_08095 [Desulfocucumaceae bacterium]
MRKLVAILILVTLMLAGITGCSSKKTEAVSDSNKPGVSSDSSKPAGTGSTPANSDSKPSEGDSSKTTEAPAPEKAVTLKDIAAGEKGFLLELQPIYKKIVDLYGQFENGAIDRTKLNNELLRIKPEMEKLNQKSTDFYKGAKLSDNDKKDPLYVNGLSLGRKMRSIAYSVITTTAEGRSVIDLQEKDASGNPVKKTLIYDDTKIKAYFKEQNNKYQEYLTKLNKSLESFK